MTPQINNPQKSIRTVKEPLLQISPKEQLRLIEKVKASRQEKFIEENDGNGLLLAQAVVFTLPLCIFHGVLEHMVYAQYDFLNELTWQKRLSKLLELIIPFFFFIYFTNRYKNLRIVQFLFALSAALAGSYLIWLGRYEETFGAMLKTPGLAVLWIYLTIQLNLPLALLSLCIIYVVQYMEFSIPNGMGQYRQ